MDKIIYKDQSAKALNFNLLEDEINEGDFSILKREKKIAYNDKAKIEAMIIGGSHIIAFEIKGKKYFEIFACDIVDSKNRRIHCGPLEKVIGESIKLKTPVMSYEFQSWLLDWEKGTNAIKENFAPNDIIKRAEKTIELEYVFPSISEEREAKTIVSVDFYDDLNYFVVWTAHCYPNEDTIVISSSVVEY